MNINVLRHKFLTWLKPRLDKNPILKKSFLPMRNHKFMGSRRFEILPIQGEFKLEIGLSVNHEHPDRYTAIIKLNGAIIHEINDDDNIDNLYEVMRLSLREISKRVLTSHPNLMMHVRTCLNRRISTKLKDNAELNL